MEIRKILLEIIELLEAIENMVIDLGGEILSPFIFRKKQLFYQS